jgi:hypothetical protein
MGSLLDDNTFCKACHKPVLFKEAEAQEEKEQLVDFSGNLVWVSKGTWYYHPKCLALLKLKQ